MEVSYQSRDREGAVDILAGIAARFAWIDEGAT
jgi:hypothetical protein